MDVMKVFSLPLWVALAASTIPSAEAARARVHESYAIVNDDATLQVSGRTIHLYGVYVPPSGRSCRTTLRPARCASRAALALDFKIQGFVRCIERVRYRDRSIGAVCHARGHDLGAYLIRRGWAVARPGAPFEYTVLERIARKRGKGVWGFQADVVTATPR
jgi:endonuclease YncB( thermonuclease family)